MGPISNSSTVAGSLQYELDFKQSTINEIMQQLNSSIKDLKQEANTISGVIDDGISLADNLDDQVSTLLYSYTNVSRQVNAVFKY